MAADAIIPHSFTSFDELVVSRRFIKSEFPINSSTDEVTNSFAVTLTVTAHYYSPPRDSFKGSLCFYTDPADSETTNAFFLVAQINISIAHGTGTVFSWVLQSFGEQGS